MDKNEIINALRNKLKEDMDTDQNVGYNEGIIEAINVVETLYQKQNPKKTT